MTGIAHIVYLVKFDLGYYADKQLDYDWSYTTDMYAAKRYNSEDLAHERGEWGIGLIQNDLQPIPTSYVVEQFKITTIMESV
jgi:hypothetical protein